MHLIDTTVIWMHPFVNIDGYNFVEKKLDDKNHPELRKNMNYENETNSCSL